MLHPLQHKQQAIISRFLGGDLVKGDVAWLAGAGAILYGLLLSTHYAGDGLRWVSTITGSWPPRLGGTNHLLYPLVAWLWYHAVGVWFPETVRLPAIQILDAVCAGAGLGLFALILKQLGAGRLEIWLGSICLAFSSAYASNATDMLEVMPSVPLIFLAIWISLTGTDEVGRADLWRCIVAGAVLSLAAAIYQASAFSLLALCGAVWWRPAVNETRSRRSCGVLLCISSFAIVAAVLYMVSFRAFGGAGNWGQAVQLSLETESPVAFGSVDPRHLVGSMFGWVTAWFGLVDFQGVSYLLNRGTRSILIVNLTLIIVQYGLWTAVAAIALLNRRRFSPRDWRSVRIILAWFVPPFLFTAYWLPGYGKLWISPLAASIAGFAVLLTASRSLSGKPRLLANAAALALCGFTITLNLALVLLPSHFTPNVYRQEAALLSEGITQDDLVVTDGWGPSATYYQYFTDKPNLGYAGVALDNPKQSDSVGAYLARRIVETQSKGGTVYFLGLLDLDLSDWQPLFGERFGMDYAQLDPYRAVAFPVVQLSEKTLFGHPLHLWQLPSPAQ